METGNTRLSPTKYGEKYFGIDRETLDLIRLEKRLVSPCAVFEAPAPGKWLRVDFSSRDDRGCQFALGIYEGARETKISLGLLPGRKTSMHVRHSAMQLVRIDLDEHARHTNPDGMEVLGSHIHIWSDRYQDKVALPLRAQSILDLGDDLENRIVVFEAFKGYCNLDSALRIDWGLGV